MRYKTIDLELQKFLKIKGNEYPYNLKKGGFLRSYDFDVNLQKIFDHYYSKIPKINWKSWLDISSREEYESLALKISGLSSVGNLFDRIKIEKTDPKLVSVDVESYLDSYNESHLIICHTSGTSGGRLSDLKWLHMSDEVVRSRWAPGMQAIIQASGLDSSSSIAIFVPSRIKTDGLSIYKGIKLIRLYSSEFSQRLTLSLIQPVSYLLDEYKNANSLQTISKLLSMGQISVVSAPASTVLGWADLRRLRIGLKRSKNLISDNDNPEYFELISLIKSLGFDAASVEIQRRLSNILSDATLVFSISSITESEWSSLRKFMRWEKGAERFTNLYVSSEIGPFAATIGKDILGPSSKDTMYVFPLTLPVIERRGKRDPISRSKERIGRLLVSYMDDRNPVINIDTGDVIMIESQEGLPRITGEVLRAGFRLKIEVAISPEIRAPEEPNVFVGDYFNLEELEIVNPRRLLACLAENFKINKKSSIVLRLKQDDRPLVMFIPITQYKNYTNLTEEIRNKLSTCPSGRSIEFEMQREKLRLEMLDSNPVETQIPRTELLGRVRRGELPKGVLKRWPLYVVTPSTMSELNIS